MVANTTNTNNNNNTENMFDTTDLTNAIEETGNTVRDMGVTIAAKAMLHDRVDGLISALRAGDTVRAMGLAKVLRDVIDFMDSVSFIRFKCS